MRILALTLIICSVSCSVFGSSRESTDTIEISRVTQSVVPTWSNPHFQAAFELAKP